VAPAFLALLSVSPAPPTCTGKPTRSNADSEVVLGSQGAFISQRHGRLGKSCARGGRPLTTDGPGLACPVQTSGSRNAESTVRCARATHAAGVVVLFSFESNGRLSGEVHHRNHGSMTWTTICPRALPVLVSSYAFGASSISNVQSITAFAWPSCNYLPICVRVILNRHKLDLIPRPPRKLGSIVLDRKAGSWLIRDDGVED
jgi:hypothetical protein